MWMNPSNTLRRQISLLQSVISSTCLSVGNTDDIDHLGNRRLRSVGELLQNQFRIGISRMERVVRERMSINDTQSIVPQQLIKFALSSHLLKSSLVAPSFRSSWIRQTRLPN